MLHLQADKLHLLVLCGLPFCADRCLHIVVVMFYSSGWLLEKDAADNCWPLLSYCPRLSRTAT